MTRLLALFSATAIIIGIAVGIAVGSDEEMCLPLGEITLESPSDEAKRSAVAFPHGVHFDFSCKECHHTWEGEGPVSGCMASGCHDLAQSPGKSEDASINSLPEIRYYKKAYHELCISCHKQMKASNKALEMSRISLDNPLPATGPTGCIECHPKE